MSATSSGKISLALGAAKKPPFPPTTHGIKQTGATNGIKRPHAALHEHDDEEGEEHGRTETVSHFDRAAGGAIDASKVSGREDSKKPLVIAPRANRDWREASARNKRQRGAKLVEASGRGLRDVVVEGTGGKGEDARAVYGLNVPKRVLEENGHVSPKENGVPDENVTNEKAISEPAGDVAVQEKTEDERAIDALLGREEKTGLVLPPMTEEEAFVRDYRDAPDMATLEDYDRVPVEQFGAALLRGMGWKEGEGIGNQRGKKVEKTKMPERRPALLGIGAKEEAAVAQELGTWGKAAKDRKGPQQVYNPVLLRDKRTGELFTEEELENKKQQDEREKHEMEFEREEKRKEKERRRRERDDSRDREDERRHRKSEPLNDRDRRKYDSDEEYYRRKEKERRRREREREGSDYDRDRSRRHDSDRERHKSRHHDHRR